MSDLIKREDAIATIGVMYERCDTHDIIDYRDLMLEAVKVLPSADRPSAVDLSSVYSTAYKSGYEKGKADRPQGEWIKPYGDSRFMCSICKSKENVPTCMGKPSVWDYCPNCGAHMAVKGADDERGR